MQTPSIGFVDPQYGICRLLLKYPGSVVVTWDGQTLASLECPGAMFMTWDRWILSAGSRYPYIPMLSGYLDQFMGLDCQSTSSKSCFEAGM